MDAHRAVRAADDAGDYEIAIPLATGNEAAAVVALDRGLREEIRRASVEIDHEASDARAGFTALFIAIPVLTLAGVAFVLFGLQRRIGEYR
jgi:cyanate permease